MKYFLKSVFCCDDTCLCVWMDWTALEREYCLAFSISFHVSFIVFMEAT